MEKWREVGWEGIKKGENCSPLATNKWGGEGQGVGEPGRMGDVRVRNAGEESVGSNQGELTGNNAQDGIRQEIE